MNIDDIIKRIHKSDIYGSFIEIGAGQPLAAELFNISGASSTVCFSLSPYSREIQEERYGAEAVDKVRSVSLEMIDLILDGEIRLNQNKRVNLFWASTLQVSSDPNGCSHGWIGYKFRHEPRFYYHVTFPKSLSRKHIIHELGRLSIYLLYRIVNPSCSNDPMQWVDGSFREDLSTNATIVVPATPLLQNYMLPDLVTNSDIYWVVNPEGHWERFETTFRLLRDQQAKTPVLIYKGSFNPLHDGHLGIIKRGQQEYPNSPIGLMISIQTYQKGEVDYKSLQKRITDITNAGFYLIITEKGLFADCIKDFKQRLPAQRWVFLAGWDTYVRMESELFEIPQVEYLIFDRHNKMQDSKEHPTSAKFITFDCPLSSTAIRQQSKM